MSVRTVLRASLEVLLDTPYVSPQVQVLDVNSVLNVDSDGRYLSVRFPNTNNRIDSKLT
jgi:hypothetical protein